MKPAYNKFLPYLLIVFGFLFLGYTNIGIIAGPIIVIGFVMILERIWPEEWPQKENSNNN